MRKFIASVAVASLMVAATCVTLAVATEGGTEDPLTGLVWSPSQHWETGSSWSWPYAYTNAAAYSVTEDGVTYADWRLATVKELIAAYNDGLMDDLALRSADGTIAPPSANDGTWTWGVWSGDVKGNKAWFVDFPVSADGYYLVGAPRTKLVVKNMLAADVVFVRP